MSLNILHISDLHFGTKKDEDKTRYSDSFVEEFVARFKNEEIDYLIVSGDIANESKPMEYKIASAFLTRVVEELCISMDNVLICMGNHDISWEKLGKIADKKGTKDLHLKKEKYDNFKKFYNDFYKKEGNQIRKFKTDAIFIEIPDDAHKILFLGVNTCYHESNQNDDHYGYIDKSSFETYFRNLDPKYKDYVKCLVMHHNPKDLAREKHEFRNWRDLDFNNLGKPFVVFCGHIHSSDGESEVIGDEDDTIHFISVGSLLKKDAIGKCNIYTISDDSFNLQIRYYNYEEDTSFSKHYWQEQTDSPFRKKILLKNDSVWNSISSRNIELRGHELDNPKKQVTRDSNNKESKSILEVIKDHQLYYSGHFHWNTVKKGGDCKFKSHGYIDINYLVSHIESLETITQLFKEKIEEIQKNTTPGKTLMISIGLECTVVGARLSVLFPAFDFSYMPRKREVNDHNDIETDIGFSDYNTVIIIKDITFDAEEVVEIIEDQFSQKSIHLISLFYCGKEGEKRRILSGKENAHFYSLIDDIEIPRCNVSESDCPIINNKLQTIYRC